MRQDAATFVVSYLLGTPITGITTTQRYPDAPRIDIRDNAMLVLENAAQLDLKGYNITPSLFLHDVSRPLSMFF